jgi:esterase/lipase/1-acyl-sn-glycerol-3-phosphate acyltransferase
MTKDYDYTINASVYQRIFTLFKFLEGRIGLNIKVHGSEELLKQGQLFVFNHFARFETAIPLYVLHKYANAHCRSVAHNTLFANEAFGNFLRSMGAIEHNKPNLLAFVAAEMLRGNKGIIFPEGGLIKDRYVQNEKGELGIRRAGIDEFRKVHRGAAALALTLELFKRRILDRAKVGDMKRLLHWRDALNMPSIEKLIEEASKPTLIVPATITFHPIRIDENVLSKTVERITKGKAPASIMEEMLVEGNLIFKDTDMDIVLQEPIRPIENWHWWEDALLRRYFNEINSLEDLFSLKDRAEGITGNILMTCLNSRIDHIRDTYTERLYSGVMINLSHLAATLLINSAQNNTFTLSLKELKHTLYLAVKNLQKNEKIYLHRSLRLPDRYDSLLLPHLANRDLERFLETCQKAGVLTTAGDVITILPEILTEHGPNEVRPNNPARVYANECAPIKAVANALNHGQGEQLRCNSLCLANHQFDDELRAFSNARQKYSSKDYAEANANETATEDASPYLLVPEDANNSGMGVLLVHGLLASPAEMRSLAEKLVKAGHTVLGVRLAGHGTSPANLHKCTWEDWLNSVQRGHTILKAFAPKIAVVGFGSGGALSLIHAANAKELAGVISVGTPLVLSGPSTSTTWLGKLSPFNKHNPLELLSKPNEDSQINYSRVPSTTVNEFKALTKTLKNNLGEVTSPVLILQATRDKVTNPKSAEALKKGLTNSKTTVHMVNSGIHGLISKNVENTHAQIIDFITTLVEGRDG